MNDKLVLNDILEHRADCHFFLSPSTCVGGYVSEKEIKENEEMAIRFTRTFGTEAQCQMIQDLVMELRMKRSKPNS